MATANTAAEIATTETGRDNATISPSAFSLAQYVAGTGSVDTRLFAVQDRVAMIREIIAKLKPNIPQLGLVSLYEYAGYKDGQTPAIRLQDIEGLEWGNMVVRVVQANTVDVSDPWNDFSPKDQDMVLIIREVILRADGTLLFIEGTRKVIQFLGHFSLLVKGEGGWIGFDTVRVVSDEDIAEIILKRNLESNFFQNLLKVHGRELSRIRNHEAAVLDSRAALRAACVRMGVTLVQ